MTTVYFVRHAEPDYNNHDDKLRPLTDKGIIESLLVTEYLKDKNITVALSSPFKRAIDTIQDFSDKNNLSIQLIDEFREREIASTWIEDFGKFAKNQWEDFNFKLSGGECLNEVQDRNVSALEKVLNQHNEKSIIIGSHGTALSTIINYYDNSFVFEDFKNIVKLMPWIVKFTFNNQTCIKIEKIDVFAE